MKTEKVVILTSIQELKKIMRIRLFNMYVEYLNNSLEISYVGDRCNDGKYTINSYEAGELTINDLANDFLYHKEAMIDIVVNDVYNLKENAPYRDKLVDGIIESYNDLYKYITSKEEILNHVYKYIYEAVTGVSSDELTEEDMTHLNLLETNYFIPF